MRDKRCTLKLTIGDSISITQLQKYVSIVNVQHSGDVTLECVQYVGVILLHVMLGVCTQGVNYGSSLSSVCVLVTSLSDFSAHEGYTTK